MVDVRKSARIQNKEVQKQLERMETIEALRHGNIYEVFAKSKTFNIADFFDFFSHQHRQFKGQIIQDHQVKSEWAACREPNIREFVQHHVGAQVSADAGDDFVSGMLAALARQGQAAAGRGKFKAATTGETAEAGEAGELPEGELGYEELIGMTEGTLGEWDQFMNDTWGDIFDAQMMQDYQKRMGEIRREVQRIITLAKQGVVGPEFVLIALAKVNATKNGVLMTWLGKKSFHINEEMNRVTEELQGMSMTDPGYFGAVQTAQQQTREGQMNQQLLMSDMQKVMQDIASVMEQVHSMMGEINRTRREIITKVAAQ